MLEIFIVLTFSAILLLLHTFLIKMKFMSFSHEQKHHEGQSLQSINQKSAIKVQLQLLKGPKSGEKPRCLTKSKAWISSLNVKKEK